MEKPAKYIMNEAIKTLWLDMKCQAQSHFTSLHYKVQL